MYGIKAMIFENLYRIYIGTIYSEFENVTAACGICTSVRPCDRSGGKASIILVSVLQLLIAQ